MTAVTQLFCSVILHPSLEGHITQERPRSSYCLAFSYSLATRNCFGSPKTKSNTMGAGCAGWTLAGGYHMSSPPTGIRRGSESFGNVYSGCDVSIVSVCPWSSPTPSAGGGVRLTRGVPAAVAVEPAGGSTGAAAQRRRRPPTALPTGLPQPTQAALPGHGAPPARPGRTVSDAQL